LSQSGILDPQGSNPQVPTTFQADTGTATPLLNIIEILGEDGLSTTASGNTVIVHASGGVADVQTLEGNSGGPISPVLGNINTIGSGSITISG